MDVNEELIDPQVNKFAGGKGNLPHASAILVLGIISIATCILYGIPGIVCGIIALSLYPNNRRMYESNPNYYEESFKSAKAGYICAIIGLCLSVAMLFLMIAAFATDNFGRGFDL